jgi:hypothetical protein
VYSQEEIPIYKIMDFENMQLQSTLGAYGGTYADNAELANDSVTYGNSVLTTFPLHSEPDSMLWVPGYQESSLTALQFGYQLGNVLLGCGGDCTYSPHVGMAFQFAQEALDLTGATHLTFWAKALDSVKVNVSVGMRDTVSDLQSYTQQFIIDTTWKQYSIELIASIVFTLPSWAPDRPFVAALANSMSFSINKGDNPDSTGNALFLDDIEIVNWVYTPFVVNVQQRQKPLLKASRLQVRFSGQQVYARLPVDLRGQTGILEAMDVQGRLLGKSAFGPQASEVSMQLNESVKSSGSLFFRARTH